MADLHLWIIGDPDGGQGLHRARWATRNGYAYLRADDLDHMVRVILQKLGGTHRIAALRLTDHARALVEDDPKRVGHGYQRIGRTHVYSHNDIPGSVGPEALAEALAPLRPRFAPGARVFLEGCRMGIADLMLAALSRALGGVPVVAGSGYQTDYYLSPGDGGYFRTCLQLPGKPAVCDSATNASGVGPLAHWEAANQPTLSVWDQTRATGAAIIEVVSGFWQPTHR